MLIDGTRLFDLLDGIGSANAKASIT